MSAAKTRRGPPPGMGKPVNKMNQRFVWTTLQLIGYRVSLQLADGQWFTGILDHIDDSNFNVTLKMATATGVREKATKEKVVLGADICQLIAADVDTRNVAKKDLKFMTDTDISGNQNLRERELVAWAGDDSVAAGGLESQGSVGTFDQFEVNERKFGVKYSYEEEQYTTKLDRSKLSAAQKKKADKVTRDIMRKKSSNVHVMEDRNQLKGDDLDEEALYGAVVKNASLKSAPASKGKSEAARVNEAESSGDRAQVTKELKKFHETHVKGKKTSKDDGDKSSKGGKKDAAQKGSKMNADAAEWNPNATEWKPAAPPAVVPQQMAYHPQQMMPHPGMMIPGPGGMPMIPGMPMPGYPPMMNPQMMMQYGQGQPRMVAPPFQIQYGPNGQPIYPPNMGQPGNRGGQRGGHRGGHRGRGRGRGRG